ncbi:hypothetical protein ACFQ0M_26445 [Kitasatospora aburaviensis]
MAQARRRVARAYRALREAVPEGSWCAARSRSGGGWRSSTRARWWSWTTGAGAPAGAGAVAGGPFGGGAGGRAARAAGGDAAEAARAYEELTVRWRRVLALRNAN